MKNKIRKLLCKWFDLVTIEDLLLSEGVNERQRNKIDILIGDDEAAKVPIKMRRYIEIGLEKALWRGDEK